MKNTVWILASLFLHVALGVSLLFMSSKDVTPHAEEIVDLTLAPSQGGSSEAAAPKKSQAPAPSPMKHPAPEQNTNSSTFSESSSGENSSDTGNEGAEGGAVGWSEITRFPKVAKEVKATYPSEAKSAGVDGPVVLDVLIDKTGKVRDVTLISGPGHGLNESAIEALKKFEFQPAQKGSDSVAVKIRYTYRFKLDVN